MFLGHCQNPGHEERVEDQQSYFCEQAQSNSFDKPAPSVDEDDCVEVEFPYYFARLMNLPELLELNRIQPDEVLVYALNKKKGTVKKMIKKNFDMLTPQDIKDNPQLVHDACMKEIQSFRSNLAYDIIPIENCKNLCTSRWVLKWKEINGVRSVKARLTIRGFQDMQSDLATFSSTAARWTQRLILSVCTQRAWEVFVADISTAFLQGLTFAEIAKLENTPIREIEFTPPKGSEELFAKIEGGKYNPWKHALRMLKAVYGLRDAPKAWRTRLCQVLKASGGVPCFSDPCLYLWFQGGHLSAIISIHVDDLKGGGVPAQVKHILALLTSAFGDLTLKHKVFEHCGLKHEQASDLSVIRLHQNHYVAQLQKLDVAGLTPETILNASQIADFLSLLGGMSWLIQTRLDIAVFVAAVQRSSKQPRGEHATRLNRVLKWAQRNPAYLTYKRLPTPTVVIAVSDSAFRRECTVGLAMRGAVVGITPWQIETCAGLIHILEFWARKQRRVTRSTFSAELNSLIDSVEFAKLLAMILAEIISPQPDALAVRRLEEAGKLPCNIIAVIDAQSVFDSLASPEIRPPSESSLIMLLCSLKEQLRSGLIRRLFWVDTLDMIADGLGKGSVSRQALLSLGNTGEWRLQFAPKGFSEAVLTTSTSELQD